MLRTDDSVTMTKSMTAAAMKNTKGLLKASADAAAAEEEAEAGGGG